MIVNQLSAEDGSGYGDSDCRGRFRRSVQPLGGAAQGAAEKVGRSGRRGRIGAVLRQGRRL